MGIKKTNDFTSLSSSTESFYTTVNMRFFTFNMRIPLKTIKIAAGKSSFFLIPSHIISHKKTYRLTGPKTVLDVTLKDDSVGLGKPEGLVDTLESGALRGEPREDCRVNGAAVFVNYGESRS